MAGPATLLENRRKPYCDWVMQTQTSVAVGFSCIFVKVLLALPYQNHKKSQKNRTLGGPKGTPGGQNGTPEGPNGRPEGSKGQPVVPERPQRVKK